MIRHYMFSVSALCLGVFAALANAQQATPTVTTVQLPATRIAVIHSDLFLDAKTGIVKFNAVMIKLNGEFQRAKDELTQMQTNAQTLETEINKLREAQAGTEIDQNSLQSKIDELDQLKKDIQRKGEDAQIAYNRRRQELFTPLQDDIGRALEAFATARGINVIIDAGQVPLLYASESTDITRAFIADFNAKNPGTGAETALPE